jgi:hypothetical protein
MADRAASFDRYHWQMAWGKEQSITLINYRTAVGAWIAQCCSAGLRAGNFSLHHRVQTGSGAYPASYSMGNRNSFLGVKRPGREADHSPPSSAEVKNALSYT